jgi:DNA repair protein RadD
VAGVHPACAIKDDSPRPLTRVLNAGVRKELPELRLEGAFPQTQLKHAAALGARRPGQRSHAVAVASNPGRRFRGIVQQLEVGNQRQLKKAGAHGLGIAAVELRAQQEPNNGQGIGERPRLIALEASQALSDDANVAVLTEGWDHPPTSCVVLLRPSSFKCTMIQMIGRGLRTVDPNGHPGVVKTDCVILDFGTSTLLHGSIEQDVDLDGRDAEPGEAPTKTCPGCEAEVPLGVKECPLCGHIFEGASGAAPLDHFVMIEIDLLSRSSFRWVDLFGDDGALVANGFDAWAGAFFLNGRWHALGGAKGNSPRLLGIGDRIVCLAAADDWLNEHESDESAHKTRRWLDQAPTEKQLALLSPEHKQDLSLTRYEASALLTFRFNRGRIRRLIFDAGGAAMERAA